MLDDGLPTTAERIKALERALAELLAKNAPLRPDEDALAPRPLVSVSCRMLDPLAIHAQEVRGADGLAFAWMGKGETLTLAAAVPSDRPRAVSVHIADAITPEALAALTITCDGQATRNVEDERRGGVTVRRAVFDAALEPAEETRVTVTAPVRVDLTERGDPRTVSVALHKIVVAQL